MFKHILVEKFDIHSHENEIKEFLNSIVMAYDLDARGDVFEKIARAFAEWMYDEEDRILHEEFEKVQKAGYTFDICEWIRDKQPSP